MKKEDFFTLLGDLEDRYILEARRERTRPAPGWRRWAALAACLALVLAGALALGRGERLPLSEASSGVTVRYKDPGAGAAEQSYCLVPLTEEELFTRWNTLIVRGTIETIRNIELDFRGARFPRAIATVRVEHIYRGAPGERVTVLLPCPVGTEVSVSATETAAAMREGMEGIFMAMVYDESSLFQANGGTLCLRDIAETGLPDGVRWAFLDTPSGLLYAEDDFPGAAGAGDLDDIGAYIETMLAGAGG